MISLCSFASDKKASTAGLHEINQINRVVCTSTTQKTYKNVSPKTYLFPQFSFFRIRLMRQISWMAQWRGRVPSRTCAIEFWKLTDCIDPRTVYVIKFIEYSYQTWNHCLYNSVLCPFTCKFRGIEFFKIMKTSRISLSSGPICGLIKYFM